MDARDEVATDLVVIASVAPPHLSRMDQSTGQVLRFAFHLIKKHRLAAWPVLGPLSGRISNKSDCIRMKCVD